MAVILSMNLVYLVLLALTQVHFLTGTNGMHSHLAAKIVLLPLWTAPEVYIIQLQYWYWRKGFFQSFNCFIMFMLPLECYIFQQTWKWWSDGRLIWNEMRNILDHTKQTSQFLLVIFRLISLPEFIAFEDNVLSRLSKTCNCPIQHQHCSCPLFQRWKCIFKVKENGDPCCWRFNFCSSHIDCEVLLPTSQVIGHQIAFD